jgi:PAS domain S-box-containing protein
MNESEPGQGRILVVAYDAAEGQILTRLLADRGHQVRLITSEQPSLVAAKETAPDLILVSTSTRSTQAGEILHRLKGKASTRDVPVLVGIDLDDVEARAHAFALGAADYVTRPFQEGEVLARVEAQLALRGMRQKLAEAEAQLAREVAERLRIEEALHEAEQSGISLVENLSDVIYTADGDGVLTYISPVIEKLIGYSPSEVIGHHVQEFIHHADLARLADNLQRVLTGHESANEYRLVTKSGEIRWIRTSSQPVLAEDQVVAVQGVLADITQSKQAEEQIRQQNEFLHRILESLTHPFYVVNAQDYTIEMANSAARMETQSGRATCYAITHGRSSPCDTAEHPCPLEEIKRTKKPIQVEHVHLDADGNARNVEVYGYPLFDGDGNVVRVIEYTLDVTERKQAEAALQQSEARWRSVAQNSPDHVMLLDTELKIEFLNYASPGLTIEELIGTPLYAYVSESEQVRVRGILENALKTAEPTSYETQFSAPDGDIIYYESRVVPRMLDDQVIGLAVNARDITEHKRVAQILREARDAAEEARRQEGERRQEAEQRRRAAESLAGVVAALNSSQPLDHVLDYIALQAQQLFDNEAVAIYRLQDGTGEFALQAGHGLGADLALGLDSPPGQEALRQAVASRRPVAIPDLAAAPPVGQEPALETARSPALSQAEPYSALLAVPIVVEDRVYGGIVLYHGEPRVFSDEEVELAAVFSDQVALAIESAWLREQVEEAAAAAERTRLARDLHDSVTQALFSASLVAEILPQVWQRNPEEAWEGLEELRLLTRGALAEMRTMLLELRPTALVETRLEDLLWQLTEAITSRVQLVATFNIESIPALPPDVHVTFYRVAQEALHNVVKHAEAGHIVISLHASPPAAPEGVEDWRGQLILQVRDDGQGFDPGDTEPGQLGLGIMRERAEAIGAMLTITSQPGQGTQVTLAWQERVA